MGTALSYFLIALFITAILINFISASYDALPHLERLRRLQAPTLLVFVAINVVLWSIHDLQGKLLLALAATCFTAVRLWQFVRNVKHDQPAF